MHDSFSSPTELKGKLMDTFTGKLPSPYDFQIGYLTKKGSSKWWIEQDADLSMYAQFDQCDTITIFFVMESRRLRPMLGNVNVLLMTLSLQLPIMKK